MNDDDEHWAHWHKLHWESLNLYQSTNGETLTFILHIHWHRSVGNSNDRIHRLFCFFACFWFCIHRPVLSARQNVFFFFFSFWVPCIGMYVFASWYTYGIVYVMCVCKCILGGSCYALYVVTKRYAAVPFDFQARWFERERVLFEIPHVMRRRQLLVHITHSHPLKNVYFVRQSGVWMVMRTHVEYVKTSYAAIRLEINVSDVENGSRRKYRQESISAGSI